MVPADFFLRLILREYPQRARLGTAARKPIAPTKLALRRIVRATVARFPVIFAVTNRAVFAPRAAWLGNTHRLAFHAVTDRSQLLGIANQFAYFAARGTRYIQAKLIGNCHRSRRA